VPRNLPGYRRRVPRNVSFKALNTIHRAVLRITGNRLGWTAAHMPVLELTTTGRISGRPHSVLLTSPVQEGSTIVVVASRGGSDTHPAWFLNLRDEPAVVVSLQGGPKRSVSARIATPQERVRLWPLVIARHRQYADYQRRTKREIPLVLIEPMS